MESLEKKNNNNSVQLITLSNSDFSNDISNKYY